VTAPRTARRLPAARSPRAYLGAALASAPLAVLALVVPMLRAWPPNSDAAAQQSIVLTWLHVGHERAFLPPDTWILKLPLYVVVESLPLSSAARITLEAAVANALMLALLSAGAWWFAGRAGGTRRRLDAVLPLAWLATLGGGMGRDLSTGPNYRNVELGLALAALALAARFLPPSDARPRGRRRRRTPATAAVAAVAAPVLLAVLWVDDPSFLALLGLPLLAACLLAAVAPSVGRARRLPSRRRLAAVAALVAGSLALVPLLQAALDAAGVSVIGGGTSVSLSADTVADHLGALKPAVEAQLHDRGRFGWAAFALGLALLATGALLCGLLAWRAGRRRDVVLGLLAVNPLLAVAAVVVKRDFDGVGDGRYLVFAVVDLVVGTAVGLAVLRTRHPRAATALTVLVAAAVVGNATVRLLAGAVDPAAHERQAQVQRALVATGATKGFAEYWSANLYVHRTAGALQLSEVRCGEGGRLQLRDFLTDTARLRMASPRTVLLFDPADDVFKQCPRARIDAQLGPPVQEVAAPRGTAVLVYPYDITARLDPAPPPA